MARQSAPPAASVGASSSAASDEAKQIKERAAAHIHFANLCARSGKLEKALVHYERALEVKPTSAVAHHNTAGVNQRLKRFETAAVHYGLALALKPSFVEAATNLAVAQLNCNKPRDAVESCYKALALEQAVRASFNAEAFATLNTALRLCGENARAVSETWDQLAVLAAARGETFLPATPVYMPPLGESLSLLGAEPPKSPLGLTPLKLSPFGSPRRPPEPILLTVVCVKWGDKYGPEYVNRLRRGVLRALKGVKHRFVCFTEQSKGLAADVEVSPLIASGLEGWWVKATLFSPAAGLSGRVLYLDLDTVIVGSLEPLLRYEGPFMTLSAVGFAAEEGVADGYNSSVMLWDGGAPPPSPGSRSASPTSPDRGRTRTVSLSSSATPARSTANSTAANSPHMVAVQASGDGSYGGAGAAAGMPQRQLEPRALVLPPSCSPATSGLLTPTSTLGALTSPGSPQKGAEAVLAVLWGSLSADVMRCLMRWDHWLEMVVPKAHVLQEAFPGLVVDYRLHCSEGSPPKEAAIVCFPRSPKPHEVTDEWVLAHWKD